MAILNTVTKLYAQGGTIDESLIQAHFDSQNANGYYLVYVDNISGWYRFFWAKETA